MRHRACDSVKLVKAEDLKPHQRAQLAAIVQRHSRFYFRLVKRMQRLGFVDSDPVYRRAIHASDAVHALQVFIEDDVGRTRKHHREPLGYLDDPETAPGRLRARLD